eukprot:3820599-Rhodomonas_salina.1
MPRPAVLRMSCSTSTSGRKKVLKAEGEYQAQSAGSLQTAPDNGLPLNPSSNGVVQGIVECELAVEGLEPANVGLLRKQVQHICRDLAIPSTNKSIFSNTQSLPSEFDLNKHDACARGDVGSPSILTAEGPKHPHRGAVHVVALVQGDQAP